MFSYDVNASRRRISQSTLVDSIKRLSAVLGGRPVRRSDFDRWPERPCSSGMADTYFGSWNAALAAAGLAPTSPLRRTPEELIAALQKAWQQFGRPPGTITLRAITGVTPTAYCARWGSVRAACHDLARFHRGEITRDELLSGRPHARTRRPLSITRRWRILRRDRYRCVLCKKSPATHDGVQLEVDHIAPVMSGGSDRAANLRTLCRDCNLAHRDWRATAAGTPA